MNTDIHFKISVPASLSIFGEHTENILRASIDLPTALIFREVSVPNDIASPPNDIEINFPQIKLLHKVSFQEVLNFYNHYIANMESLHEFQYESNYQTMFLRIFYYLFVRITHEQQIKIKSFKIFLNTEFVSNGELLCLASLKVCLVASLLHWSRLQKGVHSTFDETDLDNICVYAKCCDAVTLKSDLIDIMVCTYGSIMKYDRERDMYEGFRLPSMRILLVNLNQTQDVEAQNQRVAELMNMSPELANSILNNIDVVANTAYNVFKKKFDIYEDNELSIEVKYDRFLQQQEVLESCTRKNHRLLQMLGVSYIQLDEICAMAQKRGLSGKCTELGNGSYAYIWCPPYINETDTTSFKNELNIRGFDVMTTYLLCTGVKIE